MSDSTNSGFRVPFVGVQVGAISFIDEGVEPVLDALEEKAGANALLISAVSWSRGNAGRSKGTFPDHGVREPDNLMGGAFFQPNPKYYELTGLKDFRAPDKLYAGHDCLEDVVPEANRRGIKVYAYYAETATRASRPRWQPGFVQVIELDAFGKVAARPCLRNPQYRAWWFGVVENWLREYALAGIMWGLERQGPLMSLLTGDDATCFCTFCREEAHRRNIEAGRAAEGYRSIARWITRSVNDPQKQVGAEGSVIEFLRLVSQYPEIAQWERLWLDGHLAFQRELYGAVKFLDPTFEFGLGIWQMIDTFNPYLRAQYSIEECGNYADWVKPVLYDAPAGARFFEFLRDLGSTVLRDGELSNWAEVMSSVLPLAEGQLEDLPQRGFSTDYVQSYTRRYVHALGESTPVYPGIGVGVESATPITPERVERAVEAAFEGGAKGIVVSRNYSEMELQNLRAVGDALRRLDLI